VDEERHEHRPAHRRPTAPDDRHADHERGLIYPGEAAEILGVKDRCTYRQLQSIWFLGRCCQGKLEWVVKTTVLATVETSPPQTPSPRSQAPKQIRLRDLYGPDEGGRIWTRFTMVDIACARVVIGLLGGPTCFGDPIGDRVGTREPGTRLKSPRPRLEELRRTCQQLQELGVPNPLLDLELRREGRSYTAKLVGVVIDPRTGQTVLEDVLRDTLAALSVGRKDARLRSVLRGQAKRTSRTHTRMVPEQLTLWGTVVGDAGKK